MVRWVSSVGILMCRYTAISTFAKALPRPLSLSMLGGTAAFHMLHARHLGGWSTIHIRTCLGPWRCSGGTFDLSAFLAMFTHCAPLLHVSSQHVALQSSIFCMIQPRASRVFRRGASLETSIIPSLDMLFMSVASTNTPRFSLKGDILFSRRSLQVFMMIPVVDFRAGQDPALIQGCRCLTVCLLGARIVL